MLAPDFLARLGLFVVPAFLDREACAALRQTVRRSAQSKTRILAGGRSLAVEESVRRVQRADVSQHETEALAARLLELKPRLEEHFKVRLAGVQAPDFLVYREGSFFRPHRDRSTAPDAPAFSQERQLSAVLFLNGEGPDEESFSGGALTLYELWDDPRMRDRGLPLTPGEGLLVAFPSDLLHQVTPVTRGERYTVVAWFI